MANQTADQAFLLLGLDHISSENLINEIKKETDLKIKYSKLLHILIDRLTVMSKTHFNFPVEVKECIKNVKQIFIQNNFQDSTEDFIPSKPAKFLKWVPEEFELFTSKIFKLQIQVEKSQKKLDNFLIKNQQYHEKSRNGEIDFDENNYKTENSNSKIERSDKSIECGTELSALRKKYSIISSQVVELQQQVSETPFKIRLLKQKLAESENANKEYEKSIEMLKKELHDKENELDQEKLENVSKEKKLKKIKEELHEYANGLLKREKELKDSEVRDDTLQNLRMQLKTLSDHLLTAEKERDDFRKELELTSSKNRRISEEIDLLKAQCSILQSDNVNLKKDNQALQKKVEGFEEEEMRISGQMQQNDLKRFSAESQLKDFQTECNNLREKLKTFKDTISKQNKEIVALETQLTKTKDALNSVNNKFKNSGDDKLSLQKVGFLLADALNQKYNPKNVTSEIERLIEVAHLEHIRLSETGRIKLNPFDCPTSNDDRFNAENNSNKNKNYHSKFDEFDNELAAFSLKQFGDS